MSKKKVSVESQQQMMVVGEGMEKRTEWDGVGTVA